MGDELVGGEVSPEGGEKSPPSYKKIFWDCLPYYLAMGMSADEYWNGDPWLAKAYRKKQEILLNQDNHRSWLMGLYVYQAILLCAPRLNSIKPQKPQDYPSEPLKFGKTEGEAKQQADIAKVRAWADRVNKWLSK